MAFVPFPPFWIPDNLVPNLDEFMKRFQTAAGGAVIAGAGIVDLALISPRIQNKTIRAVSDVTGLAMFGYGAYHIWKGVTPPPPPKWIQEGETLGVKIINPYDGDYWFKGIHHNIRVDVTNPYGEGREFYLLVFVSGKKDSSGDPIIDISKKSLGAGETKTLYNKDVWSVDWPDDEYYVIAAALCVKNPYADHHHGRDQHMITVGISPVKLQLGFY